MLEKILILGKYTRKYMVVNGQDGRNSLSNGSEVHCAHVCVRACVCAQERANDKPNG